MANRICKFCGGADGFVRIGSASASQPVEVESVLPDGTLKLSEGRVEVDEFETDWDRVECASCGADARLGDLASLTADPSDRRFVCACGHLKWQHPEQSFDSRRFSRGRRPCTGHDGGYACTCQEFVAVAESFEVHADQLVMEPV